MAFQELPGGLRMEYEVAGGGDRDVVLVHGNFASLRWWRPVFARVPKGFRVWAISARGFGLTTAPGTGCSLSQLAQDLEAFAQAQKLERFHLVGHSLGGAVATQYLVDRPQRVASLLLVAPAPTSGLARLRTGPGRMARLLRAYDTDSPTAVLRLHTALRVGRLLGAHRSVLASAIEEMLGQVRLPPEELRTLVDDAARVEPDTTVGFLHELQHWDVRRPLRLLKTPTLLLWGARDPIVPRDAMVDSVQDFRRGELVIWDDVGHSPQFEQPERFVSTLAGFVEGTSLVGRLRRALGRSSTPPPAAATG